MVIHSIDWNIIILCEAFESERTTIHSQQCDVLCLADRPPACMPACTVFEHIDDDQSNINGIS